MFVAFTDLNWIAVAIAFIVAAGLGGLYYGVAIARAYDVALGRVGKPAPAPSMLRNLGPAVCTLFTTVTTAVLIEALDITSLGEALGFGMVVGVGYLAAMTFQIALNPNFPHPLFYGLLNAPYFVLTSLTTSVILVQLR
ncbi:DUF1761 domain-containing protein [Nannocystis sp. ILAH1]|uniref:DUF1761 domain-containing protein n=1 Tax=Nannocystis sp. ILAH1 TaxID=2996789 RepID=UPI002271246C|nr:DUF1761 domain-containing protein [Nannocystis sp. ILAH1]MCY0989486.1 DUF1761 domain-containing protein [Nannocystis sp. ILAH1]